MNMNRRTFIRRSGALLGAGAAFHVIPSRLLGADAPSRKIVMGMIGVGGMGSGNMGAFLNIREVVVRAVCDPNSKKTYAAKGRVDKQYGNEDCVTYKDFREMIARGDLDAVMIGTPDHWHAITAIEAARAGLDIYGEKPFSHDLREGRAMVNALKQHGRVWQTGSWQRSVPNFRKACELVRNGRIGKIHRVEVGLPSGGGGPGKIERCEPPPELDWNLWLGPAPYREFQGVYDWDWRWVLDWGGGQMMDWIGHHGDIAQWGLGTDQSGPVEFEGKGDFTLRGIFDSPTSYRIACRYANGIELIVADAKQQPKGMGARWIGEKGWVWVDRSGIDAEPKSLLSEQIGADEQRLYYSREHHHDFIECVKNRHTTITPAEVAHRSASVGHLCQIAMLTGRKIRWNPDTEEIIGDPAAAALLGRAPRSPWSLL
ncbi:MAG: Gfo/Idh/MocA family oxidoreductase [Verrucomicrobia bacterium]|nr:Gfo/Idh/MocA family oxidoreductase [Verrucomicrobiota bacterium]